MTAMVSMIPPKYPPKNPSTVPIPMPTSPAMKPIVNVPSVPYATYARMSLANWSEPSHHSADGRKRGSVVAPTSVRSESMKIVPITANRITAAMSSRPLNSSLLRLMA